MRRILRFRRRAILAWLTVLALQATGTEPAPAASVTRGPYLQQATTNSVVVRWRTDVAAGSFVRYGIAPGNFTRTNIDTTLLTNHVVRVTNLQPDIKYYYQIGTASAWFPGGTNHFFTTAPLPGTPKPTRIWALGDSGTADANAAAVRNAYVNYARTRKADVWLMLGDNAYDFGTDAEYQAAAFDMYPTILRNTVLWPTIGNHEDPPAPYLAMFTLPQQAEAGGVPSGTEHYYSFDHANIHFICLDSWASDNSSNGPMCNWLRSDLDTTIQEWIIAYWHHPPYSKGTHDSDTDPYLYSMRRNVVPILETYGVDLVLAGHSHNYERSFLIDGHYGNSGTLTQSMKRDGGDGRENGTGAYRKPAGTPGRQGAVYTVAGSSGTTGVGPFDHPAMFLSLSQLGSLVIDINSNRLDLIFLRSTGATGDYFTIIKGPPAPTTPAAPTGLVAIAFSTNQINLSWLDKSANEDGFKVERSTNGVTFVQFATVGANVTNGADIGLSPGRTYYYRVRAYNAAGNSPYSNHAQATTPAQPSGDTTPPAAVTNLLVSNVMTNRATLVWTAPGDDGNTGTATRYDVRYNTNLITEANWASAPQASGEPTPTTAGNSQSFTLSGLVAGRTYHFALKTSDETNNTSPLSNVPSATTPAAPIGDRDTNAPAAVTNLFVGNVTSNSASLSWTAPGDDGNTGTAVRYDVRYRTNLITEANWASATQATGEPMPAAAGNSQSFTLNGLTPGLTYYFALKTADETNNVSPLSNVPGATTASTAPGGTAILIASNSVWKYLDNGSNQGTAWRGLTFNDAAWPSAAATFGYGIGGEATIVNYGPNAGAKYITTYFRRAFNVAAPSIYTNVLIQLMRDDGAVVYVNGLEVYRSNMATNGPINYLSLAAQDVTGSGSTRYYTKNVSPTNLIAGANVLAVELHQSSGASSDLRFNLQLTASSGCGSGGTELSPTLSIQRQGTNVTIRWPVTCATYVLEQSSSLGALAAWSSVSGSLNVVNGQNQMTAPASASGRFYRLRGM